MRKIPALFPAPHSAAAGIPDAVVLLYLPGRRLITFLFYSVQFLYSIRVLSSVSTLSQASLLFLPIVYGSRKSSYLLQAFQHEAAGIPDVTFSFQ